MAVCGRAGLLRAGADLKGIGAGLRGAAGPASSDGWEADGDAPPLVPALSGCGSGWLAVAVRGAHEFVPIPGWQLRHPFAILADSAFQLRAAILVLGLLALAWAWKQNRKLVITGLVWAAIALAHIAFSRIRSAFPAARPIWRALEWHGL